MALLPSRLPLLAALMGLLLGSSCSSPASSMPGPSALGDLEQVWPVEAVLAESSGPVVVEFWATWCGTCVSALPKLAELERQHAAQGLSVLAVHVQKGAGDEAQIRRFAEERELPFRVLLDSRGRATDAFDVGVIPTAFVYDAQGGLLWRGSPLDPGFESAVKGALGDS
jgi:thiol-disulfide isomerase/thioredoxin